jgi:predicted AlkP superfamily pyrophosphatase or phosphodiesterase
VNKAILVIVDAMRDDAASLHLGFIEGLVRDGHGIRRPMTTILPSSSRPCYEAIVTGTAPLENGIYCNAIVRTSRMTSLFDVIFQQGGRSAAIGYWFFSQLYRHVPYDPALDCECDDENHPIAHGRFYQADQLPDSHLICQAENLRLRFHPDFILLHLNYTDVVGHGFGAASKQYGDNLLNIDMWLSRYIMLWREDGYTVFITGDHGTSDLGSHGGTAPELTTVPCYVIGPHRPAALPDRLQQPWLAAMVCDSMGVQPAATMQRFTTTGVTTVS